MMIKQKQKAGDYSQQVQADVVNVYSGISEERVRDIFNELFKRGCSDYSNEANEIAKKRISNFEDQLISKLQRLENSIEQFADPKFQFLIRDAQRTASSSERLEDYELLTELLIYHTQNGKDRKKRSSVSNAIKIIDDVDIEALCALTVVHSLITFLPTSGNILEGLKVLDNIFEKVIYDNLPCDNFWIDHLNSLGIIRYSVGTFKDFVDLYNEQLDGYVCIGIKKDSNIFNDAKNLLINNGFDKGVLVDNELLTGYVRLNIPNKYSIKKLQIGDARGYSPLTETQVETLNHIYDLYSKDNTLQKEVKDSFIKYLKTFEHLGKAYKWYDINLSSNLYSEAFKLTELGKTLAHINAKRCDPQLPDLA